MGKFTAAMTPYVSFARAKTTGIRGISKRRRAYGETPPPSFGILRRDSDPARRHGGAGEQGMSGLRRACDDACRGGIRGHIAACGQ